MDREQLKRIPLFAELSTAELEQVARWADELEVEPGRHVVDQGDFGYEFFAIIEGTADVVRDGAPIAQLGPGDFFGEVALEPGSGRRTASVISSSTMRLAVMLKRDFRRMESDLPEVAARVRQAIEDRA